MADLDRVFDVVVVGSGYAGFAATRALRSNGHDVLLIGPSGDLVWESGRAFCPDQGQTDDPGWLSLVGDIEQRGGAADGFLDGAIAEVVATDQLLACGAEVLYFARPVAVECEPGAGDVATLIVATKTGLRRVAGRQWIDATESGELLRLLDSELVPQTPQSTHAYAMLQHRDWSAVRATTMLRPTAWPTERLLTVEVPHGDHAWRERIVATLAGLEAAIGAGVAAASMSHLSMVPVSRYGSSAAAAVAAPNVANASPALCGQPITTLADRFMLGVSAAAALGDRGLCEVDRDLLDRPIPNPQPMRTEHAAVVVAGAGTGGALAALAAATAGATVICVDPLSFAGGIGTGGGIHAYWYGVAGGLQSEVDRETRALMKRFHGGPFGDGPFNPWAKMITLERMLREHNVVLRTDALVYDVEVKDGHVTAAMAATPQGIIRVEAESFVDGTGDGDLCAMAGAESTYGREHDGLLHAYSQSSGVLRDLHGRPRMGIVNFDAGFCDPTDVLDHTRARLVGIQQYLLDRYDTWSRPTYLAPALGVRQARQITTEYVLTLDDQVRRRRFDDPIGYFGAHHDNHATDFEFESDEAVFWVWANRMFDTPIACEMSYRMLVPRGLDNVWIASRCLGVTQDAHYALRMQRDIQRVGEAAGFAAAVAASLGDASADPVYRGLRIWLDRTGALATKPRNIDTAFGTYSFGGQPVEPAAAAQGLRVSTEHALADLDAGNPGAGIWWLYRHESVVHDAVLARLNADGPSSPMTTWLAAAVLAMWGDRAAEPRLIAAVESSEYGFGGEFPVQQLKGVPQEPLVSGKFVPNWLCAVILLRRCGSETCLPALAQLLDRPQHGINTLTAVAITLDRLVRRCAIGEDWQAKTEAMLERIPSIEVIGALDYAQRDVGRYSENALRGNTNLPDSVETMAPPAGRAQQLRNASEDNTWQLHLAVTKARIALGLPPQDGARPYLHDDRLVVRRAFSAVIDQL